MKELKKFLMRYLLKKASLVVSPPYRNNAIFDESGPLNRDNCLYTYITLKRKFEEHQVNLATSDINNPQLSDYVLFNEMPEITPVGLDKHKLYVILCESDVIFKKNWDKKRHDHFNKIFTWSPEYVDGVKYIKINYAQKIPSDFRVNTNDKNKFCCMIAGNKFSAHKNELYSERVRAIRWFENNRRDCFDLYGNGWEFEMFKSPLLKKFNRFKFLRK